MKTPPAVKGVRQLQSVLGLHGGHRLDSGNSTYCQARARLPVSLLEGGLSDTALAADQQAPQSAGLQGRPLKAADGSTVVLADTPENQEPYPQQKGQKPGCGFPIPKAATQHSVDLNRISFTGAMDALRHFASAMAQVQSAKKRRRLWDDFLHTLADDLVPDRPGRREPRAVKRRPKPYPRLNQPRRQFREDGQLAYC
jgi:hypothetical protein